MTDGDCIGPSKKLRPRFSPEPDVRFLNSVLYCTVSARHSAPAQLESEEVAWVIEVPSEE